MEGPGQDADGDGNIQIGGDGVVAKDLSGSIVAGGDISIVEGDVISNFSLNPEEIFQIQKKLDELARNTEILMKMVLHQYPTHNASKDYEKILHEISANEYDDYTTEEMLELFLQVDLDRKPAPDCPDSLPVTSVMWEDHTKTDDPAIFIGRTDNDGPPLLIHLRLLDTIQKSGEDELMELANGLNLLNPFEDNVTDSESLRTLLIRKIVLDNMDLSPPVLLQLNKEAIENLCVIFMLEVSSDNHSNLQSLNLLLHGHQQ